MIDFLRSIASGILYRMGGSSKFHTLWRDLGVSLVMVSSMIDLGFWHWTLALSFALLWAALTTYWDFVNKWFKHDEGEFWLNWILTGIGYSAAMLPSVICFKLWKGFAIRTVVLPASFVATDWLIDFYFDKLSIKYDRAVPKEFCRGFLTIGTLPLLAIK